MACSFRQRPLFAGTAINFLLSLHNFRPLLSGKPGTYTTRML
jgi:hypothetical protein